MGVVLEPGPGSGFLLHEVDTELDVHGRLEAGPDDFAFTLTGMPVSDEQERAGLVDRQHHFHPGDEARVVHVAAERAGRAGGNGLLPSRRHPHAPQHRVDGKFDGRRDVGGAQPGNAARAIEAPRDPPRLAVHTRSNGRWIHRIRREQAARIGLVSIERNAVDRHDQQVAWLRAFDVERPGLGVGPGRHAAAVPVRATGVDGLGDDTIARLDPERRRMRERESVVERSGTNWWVAGAWPASTTGSTSRTISGQCRRIRLRSNGARLTACRIALGAPPGGPFPGCKVRRGAPLRRLVLVCGACVLAGVLLSWLVAAGSRPRQVDLGFVRAGHVFVTAPGRSAARERTCPHPDAGRARDCAGIRRDADPGVGAKKHTLPDPRGAGREGCAVPATRPRRRPVPRHDRIRRRRGRQLRIRGEQRRRYASAGMVRGQLSRRSVEASVARPCTSSPTSCCRGRPFMPAAIVRAMRYRSAARVGVLRRTAVGSPQAAAPGSTGGGTGRRLKRTLRASAVLTPSAGRRLSADTGCPSAWCRSRTRSSCRGDRVRSHISPGRARSRHGAIA